MIEGEPKVTIHIENYHYEEIITEEKTKESKTVPKSELQLKLETIEIKRQEIDKKLEELKEKYFTTGQR